MRRRRLRDEGGRVYRVDRFQSTRCPKAVYASRKVALAVAGARRAATGELIHAYHCYACHGYHLGHPPKSMFPRTAPP